MPHHDGLKHALYNLTASWNRRTVIGRLRSLERKLPSAAGRLAVPFLLRGWGHMKSIAPLQTQAEIGDLYKIACDLKPKRVLEIGTANGGTFYLWAQAATQDATLVSIDLPRGLFGGGYVPARTAYYESFAKTGQRVHLLRADSHAAATFEQARTAFDDQPIDFAFIDGDHTYEGAVADFLAYRKLVRPGGVIGFHDILPSPDPDTKVDRLWDQIRQRFPQVRELIHPDPRKKNRKLGIGVLTVPEDGFASDTAPYYMGEG